MYYQSLYAERTTKQPVSFPMLGMHNGPEPCRVQIARRSSARHGSDLPLRPARGPPMVLTGPSEAIMHR